MRIFFAGLVLVLLSNFCVAQKSAYLKAEIGWGKTNTRDRSVFGLEKWQPTTAYRGALLGGVKAGKFSLEIGFGYSRTGGRLEGLLFEENFDPISGTLIGAPYSYTVLHHHFVVPLSLGYDVSLGKRWSLQPRLGVEGAHNAGATTSGVRGSDSWTRSIRKEDYQSSYNKYSLFGSGALRLHYRVQPSIELYGGPSYRQMMTNLGKGAPSQPSGLRTNSLTIDAGLLLNLRSNRAPATPATPAGSTE